MHVAFVRPFTLIAQVRIRFHTHQRPAVLLAQEQAAGSRWRHGSGARRRVCRHMHVLRQSNEQRPFSPAACFQSNDW